LGNKAVYKDVYADSANLEELLKFSGGLRQVPLIVEDGRVTIGYGGS
jgi:glutaredoxin 3